MQIWFSLREALSFSGSARSSLWYIVIMKFTKGDRVEVLRGSKETYVSWFPAKISLVDGDKYIVRYELFLTNHGQSIVEKVHKKEVRPCPQPVQTEKPWVLGDIAEVFDVHSWRVGKIAKVMRNNYFVVRLFGSIQLKKFHISSLRVQHVWHNNRWIKIGKVSETKQADYNHKYTVDVDSDVKFEETCSVERYKKNHIGTFLPRRTVNKTRKFYNSTLAYDANGGISKKRRLIPQVGDCHQSARSAQPRKVEAVPFSKDMVSNCGMNASSKMDVKTYATHSSPAPLYMEDDNDCSVASCSGKNLRGYANQNTKKHSRESYSSFSDDSTSSYPPKTGKDYPNVSEDKLAAKIHKLELHAYQSTMQALYASGPLSWEQESLLTNLRLCLHISNEEHLLHLRYLLSA